MLPRDHRLPSFEIPNVMKTGKRMNGNGFGISYVVNGLSKGTSRFAFIVSKKTDKRATVRNRIKRILSESVRHSIPSLPVAIDGVLIGNKGLAELAQADVEVRVREVFFRINGGDGK